MQAGNIQCVREVARSWLLATKEGSVMVRHSLVISQGSIVNDLGPKVVLLDGGRSFRESWGCWGHSLGGLAHHKIVVKAWLWP